VTANAERRRAIFQNEHVKPRLHSLEMLRAEHVNVLHACAEGEMIAQSLLRSESVPAEALSALTRFFAEYAGDRHRRKERDLLFPLMRSSTDPRFWA
jgi:hemerythrin-like domain-containing protein